MALPTRHQDIHSHLSDSSNNLSFSSQVCHRVFSLPPLPASKYLYLCPSHLNVYPLLLHFRLPYADRAAPLHGGVPFIPRVFPCVRAGNAIRMLVLLATHLSRRESETRRKEKHTRGVLLVHILTFFLSPIICLYRSELHTNEDSCTIPRAVAMMQIVESFPCAWHTYLAIYKAREEDRDSVVGDTEGASAISTIDC